MDRISAMPGEYWRTWIAALLFFGGFYALIVPFPLYLAACHFADWQIGTILGAFGVAALVGRPLAGMCANAWGRQPLLLLSAMALIVGAGGVPFTKAAAPLFALRIVQAVGYVAFTTAATARVSDLAEPNKKGSALALFGVSANLAITITPMLVNAALDTLTVRGAYGVSAGLAALAGLLSLGRASEPITAR
jgi:MFS family permease